MKRGILIVFVFIAKLAIGQTEIENKIWIIADAKVSCLYNNTITSCYKYKVDVDSAWNTLPLNIEGFDFKQGNEYRIEVQESKTPNLDGGKDEYSYKLIRVISMRNTVYTDKRILANNTWRLIVYTAASRMYLVKKDNAFINFNIDSNFISGSTGCNRFFGNSKISDSSIVFGNLGITKMLCQNDRTEHTITKSFQGKARFYVRNKILYIITEDFTTFEFMATNSLDSIKRVIDNPMAQIKTNIISRMAAGEYNMILAPFKEEKSELVILEEQALTETEKELYVKKFIPKFDKRKFSAIYVTKKDSGTEGESLVLLNHQDGTKREIIALFQ